VVGPDGLIRAKVIGPITAEALTTIIAPAVEKALQPPPAA
jgi:hypothetical protein